METMECTKHTVADIWLSRSPCFKCTQALTDGLLHVQKKHFTLHAATIYHGRSARTSDENLEGLRHLKWAGISLKALEWGPFKSFLIVFLKNNHDGLNEKQEQGFKGAIQELESYIEYSNTAYTRRDRFIERYMRCI